MKGYKAFKKGLICRNYQFEEGKVFEEEEAKICERGFHFCKNPLDTLDYYNLVDGNGELAEFAEVEALADPLTDDNKKYCTKKIKIGAKLTLKGFVEASFNYIKESCKVEPSEGKKITRKKDYSKVATSGDYSQVATSGYSSQVATSGNSSKVATSGYSSQVATSGNYSQVATSGDYSQVAINGLDSVGANIGKGGIIKGKKGCWITLAEYDDWTGKPICVKSAQIDGETIKEDVYYRLVKGEFVEA